MNNTVTGQLGVNYISMLGNIQLGHQFSSENDGDNPIFYPVSCGPGAQGGSIVGSGAKHKHHGESKWPTR